MIKSILVPMGTSTSSQAALKTAVSIANLFRAELRLCYVEDISKMKEVLKAFRGAGGGVSMAMPGLDGEQKELKKLEEEIEREKAEVQKLYEEIKEKIEGEHSFIVKTGMVAEEILTEAKTVDLLVMGEALKEDKEGVIQKSVFDVIQKAKKPMITLNEGDSLGKNILIAYDGSVSADNALKVAGDFIEFLSPKVFVLSVKKNEADAKELFEKAEKNLSEAKAEMIWKSGKAGEAILETVKEKEISFVIMGGYGDNKLKEFFLGSTTEVILKKLDIPVMVCNA